MREKKQINGFIGLLKFICVNLIVIIHTGIILPGNTQRFLAGSYIYCDFLFIVMGFYGGFERKTDGNSGDTALDYLRKRLLQWFPLVFIETIIFLCVFVLKIVRENQGAEQFLGRFTGAIYDISFLRIFVPDAAGLNGTLWFLQAALFGGTIIYFIMP